MFGKSPAEYALLAAFAIAFTHFLYGGARTLEWSDGDELAAGVAQIAFLGGAIATFYLAFLTPIALWNGLAAFVLLGGSVALYEWARRTVRNRGFHIAWTGDVPDALCADGPYARIRHPLYLSYILTFLALPVAMPSPAALAVFVLGAALFAHAAISDERSLAESPLRDAYARYRQSTGRFFPRLRPPNRPD